MVVICRAGGPVRLVSISLILAACSSDLGVKAYNEGPRASIQSPPDGTSVDEGTLVTFVGTVNDDKTAGNDLFVQWSSDIDGVLVDSDPADVGGQTTYSTTNLSVGNHVITLTAADDEGEQAEFTIVLTVVDVPDAPTIAIVRPGSGEGANEAEDFHFVAEVSDEQDPAEDLLVTFGLDDGTIFCTPVPDTTGLAECEWALAGGIQHIVFTVTDSQDLSASDDVYMSITPRTQIDDDGDGFIEDSGDCDDTNPFAFPGGTEVEDGADNDCDGIIDEGTEAYDDDGDGYSEHEGDCDDGTTSMGPDATESCNGVDDNCDGTADTEGATGCAEYYYDYDGDGYGSDSVSSKCLCTDDGYYRSGYNNDCYDYNAGASPAATLYDYAQRGDGSWDWNCDGSETKYYTNVGTCSGAVWVCSWSAGWSGTVAGCGASASYLDGCDGFLCEDSTTTVTQPCI